MSQSLFLSQKFISITTNKSTTTHYCLEINQTTRKNFIHNVLCRFVLANKMNENCNLDE